MIKFPVFLKGGQIPLKFDHPLKLEEIPTNNQVRVIDDHDSKYNYVIESDKVYTSKKESPRWIDISDNDLARKRLFDFIGNKYNFKGYGDDEREIWEMLKDGNFNYENYHNSQEDNSLQLPLLILQKPPVIQEQEPLEPVLSLTPGVFTIPGSGIFALPGQLSVMPILLSGLEETETIPVSTVLEEVLSQTKPSEPIEKNKTEFSIADNIFSWPPYKLLANTILRSLPKVPFGGIALLPSLKSFKVDNPSSDLGYLWNTFLDNGIGEVMETVRNGLVRKTALNNDEYVDPITNFNIPQTIDTTSAYAIRPLSFIGDTIPVIGTDNKYQISLPDSRQYIVPESILPQDYHFAARNREDYTPLDTEGAILTSLYKFYPYEKRQLVSDRGVHFKNYMGIDLNGNLKVGPLEIFGPGDMMSGTFANEIVSIDTDSSGNVIGSKAKTNTSKLYPTFTYIDENTGELKHAVGSTALNFLMDPKNPNTANMYGSVYGGRVLIKAGDELRLVSGSINDINREFEEMKRRNGVSSATFYTLDNGTYVKGIRTYNQHITPNDLRAYDRVNSTGGSFLYIKDRVLPELKFKSDTIWTPNVRTINDQSYLNGHGLTNEQSGVVLHHTGFMDPDLTRVTNWLTRPNGESSHVIIGYDGSRRILATPDQVTFHSGSSIWNGRANVNDFMIGIEFLGDTNVKGLTPLQIESAVEYLEPIIRKNNIRLEDIVTHQQVRDLYNDYARKNNLQVLPSKVDINENDYNKIIQALLEKVYYKK